MCVSCECMSVCGYVCECHVSVYVCMHIWMPEVDLRNLLLLFSTLFTEAASLSQPNLELTDMPGLFS